MHVMINVFQTVFAQICMLCCWISSSFNRRVNSVNFLFSFVTHCASSNPTNSMIQGDFIGPKDRFWWHPLGGFYCPKKSHFPLSRFRTLALFQPSEFARRWFFMAQKSHFPLSHSCRLGLPPGPSDIAIVPSLPCSSPGIFFFHDIERRCAPKNLIPSLNMASK